ncbi:hypothetical protein [Nocardioides sp.]|uniref:nucleotidyltransferase domain-containing protein n=1 Tax=Nocardioides sp. TaxID=35761 RepID=UPI0019CA3742|nr:hypothetical protein [Nocardioides sp.]MBC7278157.1 hypothetical protein [Nocardioides sp.]
MGVNDLSNDEFERLYGPSAPHTPADVAALLEDYPGLWWITGGWAIEAFTGVHRDHHDTDLSILREDLSLLRKHLAGRFDVWAAGSTALRPLLPDDDVDDDPDVALWETEGQLWVRRDASSPWEYDIVLSPGSARLWEYRRDPSIRMPMRDALWERDGVRYLAPEIQLLYKAKGLRPKDQADFDATAPLLNDRDRRWLRGALEQTLPDHPWIAAL